MIKRGVIFGWAMNKSSWGQHHHQQNDVPQPHPSHSLRRITSYNHWNPYVWFGQVLTGKPILVIRWAYATLIIRHHPSSWRCPHPRFCVCSSLTMIGLFVVCSMCFFDLWCWTLRKCLYLFGTSVFVLACRHNSGRSISINQPFNHTQLVISHHIGGFIDVDLPSMTVVSQEKHERVAWAREAWAATRTCSTISWPKTSSWLIGWIHLNNLSTVSIFDGKSQTIYG